MEHCNKKIQTLVEIFYESHTQSDTEAFENYLRDKLGQTDENFDSNFGSSNDRNLQNQPGNEYMGSSNGGNQQIMDEMIEDLDNVIYNLTKSETVEFMKELLKKYRKK